MMNRNGILVSGCGSPLSGDGSGLDGVSPHRALGPFGYRARWRNQAQGVALVESEKA